MFSILGFLTHCTRLNRYQLSLCMAVFVIQNTLVLAGSLFRTGGSPKKSYGSRIYRGIILCVFPDPDGEGEQEVTGDTTITHCSSAQLAFIEAVVCFCSVTKADLFVLATPRSSCSSGRASGAIIAWIISGWLFQSYTKVLGALSRILGWEMQFDFYSMGLL